MSVGSFHCSHCGARLDGAPGQSIVCPYCQARVVAPHPPGAFGPGSGGVAYATYDAGDQEGPPRELTAEPDDAAFVLDPELGPLVIGKHEPYGAPPSLRAWDARQKRVLWEAFKGQTWVTDLEASSFRLHGRHLYVASKRNLVALDLATGRQRWGAQLSDAVARLTDYGQEPRLAIEDVFPPNQPGAVLVRTDDNVLCAFDRDTGRPLYQRTLGKDASDFLVRPVPGGQVALVVYGAPYTKCERVNPAYPQPLSLHGLGADGDWSTDLGACHLVGRTVITRVESFGPDTDQDGVLVFDALTGQRHFFEEVEDLSDEIPPEAMGARVFFATEDGEGLWVGPRGTALPCPAQGFRIAGLKAAGPTLFLLLVKARGTEVRRVLGLDPTSLHVRFDCGLIGAEPTIGVESFATDGQTMVYVGSPSDDASECELVAVDAAAGNRLWARPVGTHQCHTVALGHVLVRSYERLVAFSLRDGREVASFP